MKKRFLALLAAGTLLLTGCGAQGAANSNAEAGGDGGAEDNLHHLTVVLDWYPNALHAFLYEAQEKGYFAEQGLDVDIQSPAGVNDAMSMVAARLILASTISRMSFRRALSRTCRSSRSVRLCRAR